MTVIVSAKVTRSLLPERVSCLLRSAGPQVVPAAGSAPAATSRKEHAVLESRIGYERDCTLS